MKLLPAFGLLSLAGAAIPSPPVWPANACTDKSLSIPSWVISNLTVTGSDVSFRLLNRASNYEGAVACTQGTCTAAGSAAIHVTAHAGESNVQVDIDDTWSCSDKRDPITVHATGSSTIALTAGGTPVFAETLIRGSIKSPVSLTPAYPDPPTGYDLASCSAKTESPSWTITQAVLRNVSFYIDPQTHEWVLPGLYFGATITNDLIGFEASGSTQLAQDPRTNPGPVTFNCSADTGIYNRISTTVTWNQQEEVLSLSQVWYCIENPATNQVPSAVAASGTAEVPLSCATPDPTLPEVRCTNERTKVPGSVTERAEGLPVFSLTDPPPTVGGCTVDSLTNASWTLDTFRFFADNTTEPWEIDTFYMYFYLNNADIGLWTATDQLAYPMTNTSSNNHTWIQAYVVENFDVQSQYKVFFIYDYGDNSRIDVRQAWECTDKDPAHPLLFNATGTTHLTQPPCIPWTDHSVFCKDDSLVATFPPSNWTYTVLNA
ncbi:aa93e5ef-7a4e-49e2-962f-1a14114f2d88 [Thermothielavioides terrestris]|uniref:Aa93e5ef-7a4e-49e2-962f-1a14114f2d88 n=1 Tax=Thermothielavioides terrestris TaxID=2587410 RepID=A0A446BPS2_9PEZI|nr:aa93e5ef-7a4e-49e2-962f-1a14114f2d88 [Thermothielavioides terrestris]